MSTRCGYVAIVGKPNVGKSTLLNALLQQKISITSKKPQTTRHNVLGIRTDDDCQMLFVDTPGIHLKEHRAINRYMNRSAKRALGDVDVVLFIVDRDRWDEEDEFVSSLFAASSADKILGVNKIDLLPNRDHVLPLLQSFQAKYEQADIVPISAEKSHNLDVLTSVIRDKLPESPFYYGEEQVTDRSIRFLVAELLREKITRQLGEELPYAVTIEIDRYQDGETVTEIDATIFVEKEGQKKILVGAKGEKLKRVGIDARIDMEDLLGRKVVLNTWVKVRSGWSDDERAMRSLGYDE